jgi:hypothetical protein
MQQLLQGCLTRPVRAVWIVNVLAIKSDFFVSRLRRGLFGMVHNALPRDTPVQVYNRMIDIWAAMSTVDKAELFEKMCLEADELARLGIAAREGEISPEREKFLMMELRYGTDFALSVLGNPPAK